MLTFTRSSVKDGCSMQDVEVPSSDVFLLFTTMDSKLASDMQYAAALDKLVYVFYVLVPSKIGYIA